MCNIYNEKYMEYNYSAIIFGKRDIAEADRLYTLYTKEDGKIIARAASARKSTAKLAPHLENFSYAHITLMRVRGVGKITASVVENYFPSLRSDDDALRNIFFALRTIDQLLEQGQRDPKLFTLIHSYLVVMDRCSERKFDALKMHFLASAVVVQAVTILGYQLNLGKCLLCEKKLEQRGTAFSDMYGGMVCFDCMKTERHFFALTAETIKLLRVIGGNSLASLTKMALSPADAKKLRSFADHFVAWIQR